VVVYRGGAPLWLSQGAIGGIVQLIPRSADASRASVQLTAGSFGTYGLTSDSSVTRGTLKLQALGALLGSSGDFPVAFDNKTAFDPSDDYVMRRKNADFVQGNGLFSVSEQLGPGRLTGWALAYARTGGEPSAPADPAYKTRRQQLQALGGLSYEVERHAANGRPALRIAAQGSVGTSRSRLADAAGEIGLSGLSVSERSVLRGFARLASELQLFPGLQLIALATLNQDGYAPDSRALRLPLPSSSRTSLAGGAELLAHGRVLGHRVELRPSVRVEHTRASLHTERFGAVVPVPKNVTLGTYRIAAAFELLRELSLSLGYSSGARMPSLLELFGDGALLLGNVALRPERSQSWDVGLSSVLAKGPVLGSFELRAFQLEIRDQVLFVRNSFSQLLPLNLAHSRVRGLEAGARAQLDRYWLNAALTLLDTEGRPGKRLPNRPRAMLLVQPGVEWNRLRGYVELQYIASSFDDPDNQTVPKPPALFLDRGGRDLRQFPLPGRTIMVSVTYNEG
jgi:vitamin B12 transporter